MSKMFDRALVVLRHRQASVALVALLGTVSGIPAFAQTGPQLDRLIVSASIENSDGTPWVGPIDCRVTFVGGVSESTATAVASAAGTATFSLSVVASEASTFKAAIEFWAPDVTTARNPEIVYFTNASDGAAAFPAARTLAKNIQTGDYEASVVGVMSLPALYGTINLSGSTGQDLRLAVADYEGPSDDEEDLVRVDGVERPIPPGAQSVDLYRWSRSGASEILLLGPSGTEVGRGFVRRGGTVSLTPKRENLVDVSVSEAVHPLAKRVFIVKAADHALDPSDPSGSANSYHVQYRRALRSTVVAFDAGTYSVGLHLAEGDYVAECWEQYHTPVDGYVGYRLVDFAPIASAPVDVQVVFD